MRRVVQQCSLVLAMIVLAGTTERAQVEQTMTDADVRRLEMNLDNARHDLMRLKTRNARLAAALRTEFDRIADETTYLKVKLQKEGHVPRSEYVDLRDRIDDLRARAGADSPRAEAGADPVTIPAGTELEARVQTRLNSGTAKVEDRFEATAVNDVTAGGQVAIPAGSMIYGVVAAVDGASRSDRKGSLTLSFDRITVKGTSYPIKGTVVGEVEAGTTEEIAKIGGGAAAGAIIGGILGGSKGAAIGAIVGGGGMVAATPGSDVNVPAGTVLKVRIDTALTVW